MNKGLIVGAVAGLLAVTGAASGVVGTSVYGLSAGGTRLYVWDINSPAFTSFIGTITGLQDDEVLKGIDFRPATGQLYGLGSRDMLYTIDTATGVASPVGQGFSPGLSGSSFGFDFNPTVDRIRVTSDTGQNIRLHPGTGALVFTDGSLNGATNRSVASAYTNNFAGATSTTLYNLDSATDSLYTQVPPNAGGTNLVGSLGVDFNDVAGFDIYGPHGYAVLNSDNASFSGFYRIDLATGAATFLGEVGDFQRGNEYFGSISIIPAPGAGAILAFVGVLGARRRR